MIHNRAPEPEYVIDPTELAPMATDAEVAVIGGLLVAPDQIPAVSRIVQPGHFLGPVMASIYSAMLRLRASGRPVDLVTVEAELHSALSHADHRAALEWIIPAMEYAPNVYRAEHYARIVFEAAKRRELIAAAGEVAAWAYDPAAPFDGLTVAARRVFEGIDDHRTATESGDVAGHLAKLAAPRKRGLSFRVPLFDRWFGGMVPGRLMVVAGPPGSGKTWLQGAFVNAALSQGASVAEFSLEMPGHHRLARLAANKWGGAALRLAVVPPADWTDADHAMFQAVDEYYGAMPLRIFEHQRTVDDIAAVVRAEPPDVVVVDYYGALHPPQSARTGYDADVIMANQLFELAAKSGTFLIVLSQKNQVAIRAGVTDAALGLKGATVLGDRCDHLLDLYQTDEMQDNLPVMRIAATKNRHGINRAAGAISEFIFDPSRGHMISREDYARYEAADRRTERRVVEPVQTAAAWAVVP